MLSTSSAGTLERLASDGACLGGERNCPFELSHGPRRELTQGMKLINVKMMDEKFPVGLCTLGKPWTSSERVETRQGIGPVWSLGCGVKVFSPGTYRFALTARLVLQSRSNVGIKLIPGVSVTLKRNSLQGFCSSQAPTLNFSLPEGKAKPPAANCLERGAHSCR